MKRFLSVFLLIAMLLSALWIPSAAATTYIRLGTPAIDGYKDSAYTTTTPITFSGATLSSSDDGAVAAITDVQAAVVGDRECLYFYAEVTDPDIYQLDGFTVSVLTGTNENGTLESLSATLAGAVCFQGEVHTKGTDDTQISITEESDATVINPDEAKVASRTENGKYYIECSMPFYSGITTGTTLGIGIRIDNYDQSGNCERWTVCSAATTSYKTSLRGTPAQNLPWPAEDGIYDTVPYGTTVEQLTAMFSVPVTVKSSTGASLATSAVVGNGAYVTYGGKSCRVLLRGDTNSSGSIDSNDALSIRYYFLNGNPIGMTFDAADVNGNGIIDSHDYMILRRYYLGMITEMPAPVGVAHHTDDTTNIFYYGAKADGVTDDSRALQTAINSSNTVYLPAGTYLIADEIQLRSGVTVYGDGDSTVLINYGNHHLFTAKGYVNSITGSAVHVTNITLRDFSAISSVARKVHMLYAETVDDVLVDNVTTLNIGGVKVDSIYKVDYWWWYVSHPETNDPTDAAGILTDNDLSHRVTVQNCNIDCGWISLSAAEGILICFGVDCTVTNNHVYRCNQGIQFSGGDSEYTRGGKWENLLKRKSADCTATYNYVDMVAGGGIWASLSCGFVFDHNVIKNCRDVGIDFEGCTDCSASYNKVYDCDFGNFSTFQRCLGTITFTYNESYLTAKARDGGHTQHFFNSNSSQTAEHQLITFDHNTFVGVGTTWVNCQSGMHTFVFTNNDCTNTGVFTYGPSNMKKVTFSGNTLRTNSNFYAWRGYVVRLSCANSSERLYCTNNTMTNNGSPVAVGISVENISSCTGNATVTGNTVTGYTTNLLIKNTSGSTYNVLLGGNNGSKTEGTINISYTGN